MINFHTDNYNTEAMTMAEIRQLWKAMYYSMHYCPTREAMELSILLNRNWEAEQPD